MLFCGNTVRGCVSRLDAAEHEKVRNIEPNFCCLPCHTSHAQSHENWLQSAKLLMFSIFASSLKSALKLKTSGHPPLSSSLSNCQRTGDKNRLDWQVHQCNIASNIPYHDVSSPPPFDQPAGQRPRASSATLAELSAFLRCLLTIRSRDRPSAPAVKPLESKQFSKPEDVDQGHEAEY